MFGQNQTQDQSAYNQVSSPADVDTTTHDPAAATTVVPATDSAAVDGAVVANASNLELPGSATLPGSLNQPAPVAAAAPAASTAVNQDLINIKQQALQHLSPLVDHLDQTPEERFRTTMMMIQATDDSSKIKDAYEAAQLITDEKVKAQALLDVVNEINYFSQHHKQ
jgi:hypothetical protein